MYPDPRVTAFITQNFVPARFHVKDSQAVMSRFDVQWTPTIVILDPSGKEQHRIEGFLPTEDFLAQLHLGLAQTAFRNDRFEEAEKGFRGIVDAFPASDAAAEAQYWAGVSRYKRSHDAADLKATADAFKSKYSDTQWAKRASIWAA